MPRQVDRKDASLPGQVAHAKNSVVCLDAASGNGESEPDARLIGATLCERPARRGSYPEV